MQSEATALFRFALKIDPNAINAHLGSAIVLGLEGRHREAEGHIGWLMRMVPQERNILSIALRTGKATGD